MGKIFINTRILRDSSHIEISIIRVNHRTQDVSI